MKKFFQILLVICFMFGTVILSAGAEENMDLKDVPEVTVEFGEYGLTISSGDQEYLNSMESLKMSDTNLDSFSAVFSKEQWIVGENELFLPCAEYWKAGLSTSQNVLIELYSKEYKTTSAYAYTKRSHVSELKFYVNQHGDLMIKSSDDYWLNQLVNLVDRAPVHVRRSSQGIADIKNTELVLEEGRIRIPRQVLLDHGLKYGETYVFSTAQMGTYYYQDLGEIILTKVREGEMYEDLISVHDVEVSFTDYGLEIVSSDSDYLELVDELHFEGTGYQFTLQAGWSIEEGKLFLPCQFYLEKGAKAGTHADVAVSSKGHFDERRTDYIDLHLVKDVKVFINDQNDIVISSSDDYWLEMMTLQNNEQILKVLSDPHHLHSKISSEELIYQKGQILIPYEVHSKHMGQGNTYLFEIFYLGPYQNQLLGEITVTYDLNGVNYDDLKRPSYSVSFDDYGMIISSEDIDFLSQIHTVQFLQNKDAVKVRKPWNVSENSLYIPCADFLASGAIAENVILLVSAYGYHDTRTAVKVPDFYGKVESVSVDAQGNVVIVSYDEYWMERMKATSPDSQLWFIQDSIVYAQIPFEDVEFQDHKMIISPTVQIEHHLLSNETYLIRVEPKRTTYQEYKYQPLSEVTITHGRKYLPNDAKVVKNEKGQLEISSSDIHWLEEILLNKVKTGNSSLTMRKGYGTIYRFDNDAEHEDFMWKDGKLVVDQSTMIDKGMTSGFYNCVLDSISYEEMKFTFKVDQPVIPDDIFIQINPETGEIAIHSSNQHWLKSLTELRDEYAAIYVEGREEATWFWNNSETTDLVYQNNQVVISSEAQKRRGLVQGESVLFTFYSTAYGTSDAYEVTIGKGGYKPLPEEISVLQDEQGNLIISSSDEQWLDALYQGKVELRSEELDVGFILYPENMEKQEQILVLKEKLQEIGMSNAVYTASLITEDYPVYETVLSLDHLKEKADFEVQIGFDLQEGLIIQAENADYIASISSIRMEHSDGLSYFPYDDTQAVRETNRIVIPIEEMIKDGVNADLYTVYVNSSVYGIQIDQVKIEGSVFEINDIVRLKGKTRYETALKIADALKEVLNVEKFDAVILANGRDFADALSGSVLAVAEKAPILMVDSKNNNMNDIIAYLKDNLKSSGKVYILGGEAAVGAFAEEMLQAEGYAYERIKGKNRYETNLEILKKANVTTDTILIANGKNFADSLSASATGIPMLLVGNQLNESQMNYLSEHTGKHFVILGGTAAVSETIEQQLTQWGTTERIAGKTRYETSIEIAKRFFFEADTMILAYAKNYPDGLCGGPLAYFMQAPLILTSSENKAAAEFNSDSQFRRGAVLGGDTLISDDAVYDIFYKYPIIK